MKGVLFNVVEEVVVAEFGAATWDQLLVDAGVDGAYTSLGSYPDEDMLGIVQAAAAALDQPVPDVLRLVGRKAFEGLARRNPHADEAPADAQTFVEQVESHIHPEVQKLYPDAILPRFAFEKRPDGWLRMVYSSPRGLDALAEGLVHGAADYFGQTVEVVRPDVEGPDGATVFDLKFST